MKMKIGILLGVIFLIFVSLFLVSSSVQAKPTKKIVVGAKLNKYRPPKKQNCDINVPAQYTTIQAGVDNAVNGDTVCVNAGIYDEDVFINKPIRLSGKGARKTIINGQTQAQNGTVIISAIDVTVEGFLINGIDSPVNNTQWAMAIYENKADSIVRYNWIVSGNEGIALFAHNQQNRILVHDNILEGDNSIFVAQTDTATYLKNTFVGTVSPSERADTGFTLNCYGPNCLVKQNVFDTSGPMVLLIASNNTGIINENNFNSDTTIKVGGTAPINAENNWWGDTDPSDNIQSGVDFTPFALTPFPES